MLKYGLYCDESSAKLSKIILEVVHVSFVSDSENYEMNGRFRNIFYTCIN